MTDTQFDYRTATDEQTYRHEARRQAENIATRMESVAARIREQAALFDTSSRPAAGIAADIVQDYMQMSGNVGPAVWGLISELPRMSAPSA